VWKEDVVYKVTTEDANKNRMPRRRVSAAVHIPHKLLRAAPPRHHLRLPRSTGGEERRPQEGSRRGEERERRGEERKRRERKT